MTQLTDDIQQPRDTNYRRQDVSWQNNSQIMILSRNRISRQNQAGRAVSSAFGPDVSMAADTPGILCCRHERMRLILSELSRCACFYVAIVHAISCHLPSVLSVVVRFRYKETRTYWVRTAVCTTSMNAN